VTAGETAALVSGHLAIRRTGLVLAADPQTHASVNATRTYSPAALYSHCCENRSPPPAHCGTIRLLRLSCAHACCGTRTACIFFYAAVACALHALRSAISQTALTARTAWKSYLPFTKISYPGRRISSRVVTAISVASSLSRGRILLSVA